MFRHGMQTASDASSQDLALNSTPDDSTPETSRRHLLPQQQYKTQSTLLLSTAGAASATAATSPPAPSSAPPSSTPDHSAARKKWSRMVVPLAVLEEFSEGSSSREVWSADELSEGPCAPGGGGRGGRASGSSSEEDRSGSSENNADASSMVEGSTSPTSAVRARRNTFRRSRSKQKSMNGPVAVTPTVHGGGVGGGGSGGDSCIVDLNSNAKDSLHSDGDSPRRTYEELQRLVISDQDSDSDDDDDGDQAGGESAQDDESAMLRFAEKYFNSHVIHIGYPNAITKTMNIVTRKSLNVSRFLSSRFY